MTDHETPPSRSSTLLIRHETTDGEALRHLRFWIEDVGQDGDSPLISVEVLVLGRHARVGRPSVPPEHAGEDLGNRLVAGVLRQLASDGVVGVDLDETLEEAALADLSRCGFRRTGGLGFWEIHDAI